MKPTYFSLCGILAALVLPSIHVSAASQDATATTRPDSIIGTGWTEEFPRIKYDLPAPTTQPTTEPSA